MKFSAKSCHCFRQSLQLPHRFCPKDGGIFSPSSKTSEFNDAIGDPRGFSDFVDKTLALLTNSSSMIKTFSLNCEHNHDKSRVDTWIRTVLKRGFLELHLQSVCMHFIQTEFFTSTTLVKLTLTLSDTDTFRTDGYIPHGVVYFPKLKTLSLVLDGLAGSEVYVVSHLWLPCS
uniref:F-box/LRR-repeat protein n=1 Tax=Noccaea caerulescens TaxID=107243 RepID=A0A1J3JHK7_NOCCA